MTKNIHFNVRAGLKSIIGKDLITNDIAAIFELVKNSFDANSKNVLIVFLNIFSGGSKLIIQDNGCGMSEADIENKWMPVGYSEKIEKPSVGRRIVAGTKGIGRFSCDRLGKKLNLYSKATHEKRINLVKINWDSFDKNIKRDFLKVYLLFEKVNDFPSYDGKELKRPSGSGTTVEIESLRSGWNKKKIDRLKLHLSRLINPFRNDFSRFEIRLYVPELKIDEKIDNTLFEDLDTIYTKASVNSKGVVERILVDKSYLIKHEEIPATERSHLLKRTTATIYWLDSKAKYRFTKRMGIEAVNYGSIFLYRNGFRILPYGDVGDDWLGIDKRHAQGYARTIGLRDIIGFVDIRVPEKKGFLDVSSRQGLGEEAPEFQELKMFIQKQARFLEAYVVSTWETTKKDKWVEKVAFKSIEQVVGKIKDPELKTFTLARLSKIKEISRKEKKMIQMLKKQNIFLKATAKTSPEALNLIHTMKISSGNIKSNVKDIKRLVSDLPAGEKILRYLNKIQLEANKILITSRIATRANFDMKVKEIKGNIVQYIFEYLENYWKTVSRNIEIETKLHISRFTTAFIPLEISIIIDNLIDNSYKAGATMVRFIISKEKGGIAILIKDDGSGLKNGIEGDIFELGFTTTGGSGLGLFHVRELVEKMDGKVTYNGVGVNRKGASFKIVLGGKNGN